MKKILIFFMLVTVSYAATNKTTNQNGASYFSDGSARDTAAVSWNEKTYINTHSYQLINMQFKMMSTTADSIIFLFLGSNQQPDSIKFYSIVHAETLITASAGDSIVNFAMPSGTSMVMAQLPYYLKVRVIGAADDNNVVSTIADSWAAR